MAEHVGYGSDQASPYGYAVRYARMGWPVFPLAAGTKVPAIAGGSGVKDATTDIDVIRQWWVDYPRAGVAVAMGKDAGVFAVDIDPRDGGDDSWDILVSENGAPGDTIEAITGGGGRHLLFRYPEKAKVANRKLAAGIDIKSDGGYIVVEPSVHPNGNSYVWEGSSDPFDGVAAVDAPFWLLDKVLRQTPAPSTTAEYGGRGQFVAPSTIDDLRGALQYIPADDYQQWVEVGMALHSLENDAVGFELWDEWSQRSDKYDGSVMLAKWNSFNDRPDGLTHRSIFTWADQAGWRNPAKSDAVTLPGPVPADAVKVKVKPSPETQNLRDFTLDAPGVLQDIVQHAARNAPKPQPALNLQAGIASLATIVGRRFRTTANNYPSLYFLNVAKSASGKEYAKELIEEILAECNKSDLIGGSGFTSGAAVMSALLNQPSHINVMDEFGKLLQTSQAQGNHHKAEALTALMEAFGRVAGTMRPQSYSTMNMSQTDAKNAADREVKNPALSFLAMTTPSTFYDAISSESVKDGFLGRFLVVESQIGRNPSRFPMRGPLPAAVKDWAELVRSRVKGNMSGEDIQKHPPKPVVLDIEPRAMAMFRDFESRCLEQMDELESEGIDALAGRTNEKAMRLALVVALARDPMAKSVTAEDSGWAIDYVEQCDRLLIESVRQRVADSPFEKRKNECLQAIEAAGTGGLSRRDMGRRSRAFRKLSPREQQEVLDALASAGLAAEVTIPSRSGRGRPRQAWVAIDQEAEGSD